MQEQGYGDLIRGLNKIKEAIDDFSQIQTNNGNYDTLNKMVTDKLLEATSFFRKSCLVLKLTPKETEEVERVFNTVLKAYGGFKYWVGFRAGVEKGTRDSFVGYGDPRGGNG